MAKRKRRQSPNQVVRQLGFPAMTEVGTFHSIAHLFGKSKPRCGIYLLGFSDGLFYVGQATDVVNRFAQHRLVHGDIERFSFQKCRRNLLDETEKRIIQKAEAKGLQLTNKVHVVNIVGDTDFDHLVLPDEQESFLVDPDGFNLADKSGRIDLPTSHRNRFRRKHKKFEEHLHSDRVSGVLGRYVHGCVPAFRRTEHAFWSMTCLPSTNSGSYRRLSCVSINVMEVFVVGWHKEDDNFHWAVLNVSCDQLDRQFPDPDEFFRSHPGTWCEETGYQAAGIDQMAIHADTLPVIESLVADHRIRQAAAQLNLRLMRKGPTVYSRFHCIDLADRVLGDG